MDKINKSIVAGIIAVLLIATIGIVFASGQINGTNDNYDNKFNFKCGQQINKSENNFSFNEFKFGPFFYNLTEEQQTELNELIKNLKNEGANSSVIRDAIQEKLDEWGILDKQLDNQIAQVEKQLEILNREKELRNQGYSWDEINQIIQDEYNLDYPIHNPNMRIDHGFNRGPCGPPHGFRR